jgi:hypothetical protein
MAFWALIIMVPLIIIQMVGSGRRNVQELTYTDFMRELEQGNVLKVVVIDGKEIEGELRAPVVGTSSDTGRDFWTKLPVWHSEDLLRGVRGDHRCGGSPAQLVERAYRCAALDLSNRPDVVLAAPDAGERQPRVLVRQIEGEVAER